jgi:hypothetical protein
MSKARRKLVALGPVHVGERFIVHTAEIFGDRHRKLPFEGHVVTVVGFEPKYKNNVVLQDVTGEEFLLPLDMVEKALHSRRILM